MTTFLTYFWPVTFSIVWCILSIFYHRRHFYFENNWWLNGFLTRGPCECRDERICTSKDASWYCCSFCYGSGIQIFFIVPYVRILVHSIATRSPAKDCKLNFNKEARWLYAELIKSYISFHATSQLLKEPFYIKEPFVH